LMNLLAVAASSSTSSVSQTAPTSTTAAPELLAVPVASPVVTASATTSTASDASVAAASDHFAQPPLLPLMPAVPLNTSSDADMKRQSSTPPRGLAAILSVAMEAESKPSVTASISVPPVASSSSSHSTDASASAIEEDEEATAAKLESEEMDELTELPPTPLSPSGADMCWPEAVRGIRKQKQKLQYLIKWRGFKTLSWEPADSFSDDGAFQELVESFKQRRANRSRTRSRRSRYPRSRKNALDVAADADGP